MIGVIRILIIATAILWSAATARAADSFFTGRQVRLIVPSGSGGGYDSYARLVSRFLGKDIAGQPNFIVVNMSGASGVKALNYLYSVAPKDGSVISIVNNTAPFSQVLGEAGVRYKLEELSWLSALNQAVSVLVVWHTTGVKTIEDAKHTQVIMGASGGERNAMVGQPALLNNTLGTKFKIVTGYDGTNQIDAAMERGEMQGRGSSDWSFWLAFHPDWVKNHMIVPLVQVGLKKRADLPNVPLLTDLAENDEQRKMFEFISAPAAIERPFAAPPNIPGDRLNTLRRGFDALVKDQSFLAAAKKQGLDIDPQSGEAVQKLVADIIATPPDVVEKTSKAMLVN